MLRMEGHLDDLPTSSTVTLGAIRIETGESAVDLLVTTGEASSIGCSSGGTSSRLYATVDLGGGIAAESEGGEIHAVTSRDGTDIWGTDAEGKRI
jgi:hypothetical protein